MATVNDVCERTDQAIDSKLIDAAVHEVKDGKASSDYKLQWSESCDLVLNSYYNDHYSEINNNSPEYEIIQRSKAESISGDVLDLPGGKANTFKFPMVDAAYVIIPMTKGEGFKDEGFKVEVIDSKGVVQKNLEWRKGSLIYVTGSSTLKCIGEGSVICIILALNPIR